MEALQLTNELLKNVPYHQRALGNKKHYEQVLLDQGEILHNVDTAGYRNIMSELIAFIPKHLCRSLG